VFRTRAITTDNRNLPSYFTSTRAVANLAILPSTVNPHVMMDRLPVDFTR